jgi:hypothetical protein
MWLAHENEDTNFYIHLYPHKNRNHGTLPDAMHMNIKAQANKSVPCCGSGSDTVVNCPSSLYPDPDPYCFIKIYKKIQKN